MSTWVVNSIVFFAILVMILLSNLFVLALKPRVLWPEYLVLTAVAFYTLAAILGPRLSLTRSVGVG
jgi:hypothetical protein